MLSWLSRRRPRIARIEAEAEMLVRDLGEAAHSAARRRRQEASSDEIAKDWGLVALAVARLIRERAAVGTRAMNAGPLPDREVAASREPRSFPGLTPAEELARVIGGTTNPFRIQFVGAAPDDGPITLMEVDIQAADVSAPIVAAPHLAWPPRTIGLRILDGEGREVFAREKPEPRARTTKEETHTASSLIDVTEHGE